MQVPSPTLKIHARYRSHCGLRRFTVYSTTPLPILYVHEVRIMLVTWLKRLIMISILMDASVSASKSEAATPEMTLQSGNEISYKVIRHPFNDLNIFSITADNHLLSWDLTSKNLVWDVYLGKGDALTSPVVISPDGRWIAAESNGCIAALAVDDGERLREYCAPNSQGFFSIAISNDGRTIIAGKISKPEIYRWDAQTGKYLGAIRYPAVELPGPITPPLKEENFNYALELNATGNLLVVGNLSTLRVIDVEKGKVLLVSDMGSFYPNRTITKFAFSPDLRMAVASVTTLTAVPGPETDDDQGVSLIIKSTEDGKLIGEARLKKCLNDVRHLEVSWDSRSARVLCGNGEVFDVELNRASITRETNVDSDWQGMGDSMNPRLWLSDHALSKDGDYLYAAAADGIRVWKIGPRTHQHQTPSFHSNVTNQKRA